MRWVLLAWLLCWASVAPAEVYRWTDEHGRVHYGERPPSQDARRIELPASNSPPPPADGGMAERRARQERLLDSYAYERDRKAAKAASDAEAQRARSARCESLRRRWRRLSHSGPIYLRGPNDKRDYFSDEQRAAEKRRMRPAYQAACGKAPD